MKTILLKGNGEDAGTKAECGQQENCSWKTGKNDKSNQ